jgi:hypothetical protein
MSNQPTLEDWLTKQQAAQFLGVAEKTVDRMAAKGELQKSERKQPGRAPIVVFHPDDVGKAKAARQHAPEPFVMQTNTAVQPMSDPDVPVRPLLDRLSNVLELAAHQSVPLRDKVYLTMAEAHTYSGLSRDVIRQAVRDGKVKRLGRVYRRADLEQL